MENKKDKFESALKVQKGINQPPQTNEEAISKLYKKNYKLPSLDKLLNGIIVGDRVMLSRAITLIESSKAEHQEMAQKLIEKCLPMSGNSIRIGITGVPGAGKSTLIETFGNYLTDLGKKVAVLAIDPSSQISKGSILGDKTRMEKLSANPAAFIRPSPSEGTLGGVARKTRESMILCEAAGFDIIIIETVGVGQSETAARSMVDFFLLLQIAGAGDELQGIKRGIMEMADAIFVNKAEGDNLKLAKIAAMEIKNALHLMPKSQSGWTTEVGLCSAIEKTGISDIWKTVLDYVNFSKNNGYFMKTRHTQEVNRYHQAINDILLNDFNNMSEIKNLNIELAESVYNSKISPYSAAQKIIENYYSFLKKS